MWGESGAWWAVQVGGKLERFNLFEPLKLECLGGGEVCGMSGVAVKCIDITQNSDGEGSIPAPD